MKIRQLCAFLLASVSLSVAAQDRQPDGPTAADFFVKAPFEIASQLSEMSRLDMIDYFNSGSTIKSENRLGRKVGLTSMSDTQIAWCDDDSVATSITVLPIDKSAKSDTLLLVIRTVNGVLPDSEIRFFNKSWGSVDRKDLPRPQLNDWLVLKDKKSIAACEDEFSFILSTAEFNADANTLVITNRTSDYYPTGHKPNILDNMKNELRYLWTGAVFKPADR